MKYFSTFTGIGGFEIGIERAIDAVEQRRRGQAESTLEATVPDTISEPIERQHATCIGYSEIDKYATSVYERHYPNVKNYGDITTINAEELPDFDCLVGGFPCQAFSVAGKRGGFEDTRGTLFFDLARILRAKQPRLFVFENVKGLLSHDNGKTFRTIITTIDELGYDAQWQIINSKNHGVPQNRERIIIVGHLRGTPRPEVFPLNGTYEKTSDNGRGDKVAIPVLTPDRIVKRQNGRRFKNNGEPAFTVNTQDRHGVLISKTIRTGGRNSPHGAKQNWDSYEVDGLIRRLTPVECERLQAFPDDWTKYGKDGEFISDTQRYKMCGNAVTTNVIRDVFERILA